MAKAQSNTDTSEVEESPLISNEKLLAIHTAMLRSHLLEQRATELFQHGLLDSDFHVSSGREAAAAAAALDLQESDTLCLAPGDWLPSFQKGLSLETLFRALAPATLRLPGAEEIEAANKNILVPASKVNLPKLVLDRASASAASKRGDVVEVFLSPGPGSLSAWKRTINLSGTKRLPIVFVHYSDASAIQRTSRSLPRTPVTLHEGIPSIAVDGLDPVAVYRVAYEAIVRARQLRGATLIECLFQPPASTNGSPSSGNQSKTSAVSPLAGMESYLRTKGIDPGLDTREVVSSFQRELDSAIRFLQP